MRPEPFQPTSKHPYHESDIESYLFKQLVEPIVFDVVKGVFIVHVHPVIEISKPDEDLCRSHSLTLNFKSYCSGSLLIPLGL